MPESLNEHESEADDDLATSEVPEGHQADEDGEHDPSACYQCLIAQDPAQSQCHCGKCCHLLIDVEVEDAERELRIKERGSPTYADARFTASGQDEIIGYMLNVPENDFACAFLDRSTGLCTIYETRPLICRLFDCDGDGREQMIELGYFPRTPEPAASDEGK